MSVPLETLRQISQKSISTASRRQVTNKVPELQKHFQEDNGIPVYLKGGTMDAMLYRTTMILSVFGKTLTEKQQSCHRCIWLCVHISKRESTPPLHKSKTGTWEFSAVCYRVIKNILRKTCIKAQEKPDCCL
uniref:Cytochrome c oxidase subunit 7A2, mitochondrial n=1 Tax=Podarcis muralis TaxID=64176 RepID=A0A670IIS8_PODMU